MSQSFFALRLLDVTVVSLKEISKRRCSGVEKWNTSVISTVCSVSTVNKMNQIWQPKKDLRTYNTVRAALPLLNGKQNAAFKWKIQSCLNYLFVVINLLVLETALFYFITRCIIYWVARYFFLILTLYFNALLRAETFSANQMLLQSLFFRKLNVFRLSIILVFCLYGDRKWLPLSLCSSVLLLALWKHFFSKHVLVKETR